MSENVREKAEQALALVDEVNAVVLPEPADANAVVSLAEADAPLSEEIRSRMDEIDMGDTNSIVSFGSAAQAELQEISQSMLQGVRNKDVPCGGFIARDRNDHSRVQRVRAGRAPLT